MIAAMQLNDVAFFAIDTVIVLLLLRTDHLLKQIERNTRPPPDKKERREMVGESE